jgi:hypothetical protein
MEIIKNALYLLMRYELKKNGIDSYMIGNISKKDVIGILVVDAPIVIVREKR